MIHPPLILASQSPRRRDILQSMRISFCVKPSYAEEFHPESSSPEQIVLLNAQAKAHATAAGCEEGYVIGADTIVFFDGSILTKPADFAEAKQHLHRLNGQTHTVYTGITVHDCAANRAVQDVCCTKVTFRTVSAAQIERYIELVHPYDKAGGYAIQGFGALIVEKIDGCFFNVMGLPIITLERLLNAFEMSLFDYVTETN